MPNIFEYATSELSQDAMIAWLMACAKADDAAMREVGQSFIRFLLDRPLQTDGSKTERAVIGSDDSATEYDGEGVVSLIKEVETQYRHVDVYCRAEIDGKLISFVIEDKTGTTQHSGQLDRYRKLAQSDERHEDYLKLIYLKTGMPFPDELDAASKAKFCPVDVHDLNTFLNGQPVKTASSDLLQQYRTHISKLADEQNEAKRDWNMNGGPIQREFAAKLQAGTSGANDSWAPAPHDSKPDVIWQSRNRGGDHWTQYRFFGWHLFWRMDSYGDLRMMVDKRQPHPSDVDMHQYRGAFCRACGGIDLVKHGKFRRRSGNEMTVGAIKYPAGDWKIGQDVDTFLQSIAQVHERFLQELAQIRADNPA